MNTRMQSTRPVRSAGSNVSHGRELETHGAAIAAPSSGPEVTSRRAPNPQTQAVEVDAVTDVRFSPRELEVATAIARGDRQKTIAHRLSLSTQAVGTYRSRTLKKLGIRSNVELAAWFERQQQQDYRQALVDLVAFVALVWDDSDGRYPKPVSTCTDCTVGCAPENGVCAYHRAQRLVKVRS